ncbi:MAG TPA: helix-hairpin-helix domain-containing protein [Longimicrobium sp.]|nr:helix-hairpin-helix domain-containing protein [Longimicrobium sp.]
MATTSGKGGTAAGTGAPAGGRKKRETYQETAARRKREKEALDLRADLRAFAEGRPSGWEHADWVAFLEHLAAKGHDTSDCEAIGRMLERERLAVVLEKIPGLGPRRVDALAERFETLWSIRHATAEAVAAVQGIPRALAERVVEAVR